MRAFSALPCHVSTASASVPSTSWSEKSTSIVVPPATAAAVPVSQSSAVTVPPNGMSMCVCPSMKPGITRAPETSTTSAPSRGRSTPTASIVSPSTATSAAERALGGHDRAAGEDLVAHACTALLRAPRRPRPARRRCGRRPRRSATAAARARRRCRGRPRCRRCGRRSSPRCCAAATMPAETRALGRRARRLVGHQLDPDQQAAAAHVADQRVVAERVAQPRRAASAPSVAERSTSPSSSMIAIVSSATAQPAGWPPNVLMWRRRPGSAGSAGKAAKISSLDDGRGERDVGARDALGHRHDVGPHAGGLVAEPACRCARSRRSPRRRSAARRGARTSP